jgi:hypothetical protein
MESEFGIKDFILQRRIVDMINGEKKVADDFVLLNPNQARNILRGFVKKDELLEQLVEMIDSDMISAF